jgi:hypothetical protein
VRFPFSNVSDIVQFIFHDGEQLFINSDGVSTLFLDGDDVIVAISDVGVPILLDFIIFPDELLLLTLFLFII